MKYNKYIFQCNQFVKVKSTCIAVFSVDFDGQILVLSEWVNA